MNYAKPLVSFCLSCAVLFPGCKKNNTQTPPVTIDSLHININFPAGYQGQIVNLFPKYELIISETGGKVLLDTLTNYNAPVIAWLKTNQTLLDITTVKKSATTDEIMIHSYKAIDPTGWVNIPDNDSIQVQSGGTVPQPPVTGIMTYSNVNVPSGSYYNMLYNSTGPTGQVYGNTITGVYNVPSGDYVYLIFPELGLYNLHRITGTGDVIDFSMPDTAVRVKFNVPSVYNRSSFFLTGYQDPGDLAHQMNLTYVSVSGIQVPYTAELVYPGKKGFKKYRFTFYLLDENNNHYSRVFLPYIDTIPANLPIPDPAWYSISSTKNTTVSVDFKTHKPTCYDIISHVGSMYFILTAPGDSTMLHPLDFYTNLKSKLLDRQDLGGMQLDQISILTDAEPNYQAYWGKKTKIHQLWKEPESSYTLFEQGF